MLPSAREQAIDVDPCRSRPGWIHRPTHLGASSPVEVDGRLLNRQADSTQGSSASCCLMDGDQRLRPNPLAWTSAGMVLKCIQQRVRMSASTARLITAGAGL